MLWFKTSEDDCSQKRRRGGSNLLLLLSKWNESNVKLCAWIKVRVASNRFVPHEKLHDDHRRREEDMRGRAEWRQLKRDLTAVCVEAVRCPICHIHLSIPASPPLICITDSALVFWADLAFLSQPRDLPDLTSKRNRSIGRERDAMSPWLAYTEPSKGRTWEEALNILPNSCLPCVLCAKRETEKRNIERALSGSAPLTPLTSLPSTAIRLVESVVCTRKNKCMLSLPLN